MASEVEDAAKAPDYEVTQVVLLLKLFTVVATIGLGASGINWLMGEHGGQESLRVPEILMERYMMKTEPNEWVVHYIPQCGYSRDRMPSTVTITTLEVLKDIDGVMSVEPRYVEKHPVLQGEALEAFMQNL